MQIIIIANVDTKELETLIDILYQQMLDIKSKKSRSSIELAIKNALKPEARSLFFLAKQDTIPIGVVFVNICSGIESGGDYIWINEIQISPEFRGKGVGRKLLRYVLTWAKEHSMKSVLGVTDIDNNPSQALFKSEGFDVEEIMWMKKA